MDWNTFWISFFILIFLLNTDITMAIIISSILGWVVFSVPITEGVKNGTIDEQNKIQLEVITNKKNDFDVKLLPVKPKLVNVINTKNYDSVKRSYITIDKRTSDYVQMKTLAGKTYACMEDDTCITEPTMKRHINNVLFACGVDVCYPVQ